jgi:hypothetical protein
MRILGITSAGILVVVGIVHISNQEWVRGIVLIAVSLVLGFEEIQKIRRLRNK